MTANLILYLLSFNFLFTSSCNNMDSNAQNTILVQTEAKIIAPKDTFTKAELIGDFDQSKHSDFVVIERKYSNKDNIYLRKEAYEAFLRMHHAAKKDGVSLIIVSATRNFNYQKKIWEDKWSGRVAVRNQNLAQTIKDDSLRARTILLYSSMPGTSRHHWGTDIDINNLNDAYFLSGQGKKEYDWLVKNAATYGFCQTYTKKGADRPDGYEEEKWHWSYTPISAPMLKAYQEKVTYQDIKGFLGAESAAKIEVIKNYVLGVNSECK